MLKTIRKIIRLLDSKDKQNIYFLFFCILAYSLSSIFPVFLIEKIVDSINISDVNNSIRSIIFFGISYLVIQALAQFLYSLSNLIAEKTQINFSMSLQKRFFANLLTNPINDDNSITIANKLIEDTRFISDHSFTCITIFFRSIFTFIIGLCFMCKINVVLTLIIFPVGLFVSLISKQIEIRIEKLVDEQRKTNEKLWMLFSEGIRGVKTLYLYDQKRIYYSKLCQEMGNLKQISYKQSKTNNYGSSIVNTLYMFAIGIILISSAIFVTQGWISFGGLTALIMYNHMLIDPLLEFFECRKELINIKISLERILSLLNDNKEQRKIYSGRISKIKLDSISFAYDSTEKYILNDISYSFEIGKKYVLFGQSGSGKSTLIKLISNFLTPNVGTVSYISNDSIIDASPDIAYLMQDGFLFDDTIENNIKIANPGINRLQLEQLIKDCLLEDVVTRLEGNTIGENGSHLSGGEKKRVLLAQTLSRSSASIVIFDELSSSLDDSTFEVLLFNVQKYIENKISIFIEHNSSCEFYDFIKIRLENGILKNE